MEVLCLIIIAFSLTFVAHALYGIRDAIIQSRGEIKGAISTADATPEGKSDAIRADCGVNRAAD